MFPLIGLRLQLFHQVSNNKVWRADGYGNTTQDASRQPAWIDSDPKLQGCSFDFFICFFVFFIWVSSENIPVCLLLEVDEPLDAAILGGEMEDQEADQAAWLIYCI